MAHFERGWRAQLAAQRLTALAVPPACALAARFRVCGLDAEALHPALARRLHALPGGPRVQAEPDTAPGEDRASGDWQGVRVWLSYRAQDLPALLKRPARKPAFPSSRPFRGRRP